MRARQAKKLEIKMMGHGPGSVRVRTRERYERWAKSARRRYRRRIKFERSWQRLPGLLDKLNSLCRQATAKVQSNVETYDGVNSLLAADLARARGEWPFGEER